MSRDISGHEIADAIRIENNFILRNTTVNSTGVTLDVSEFPSVDIFVTFPVASQSLYIEFRTESGLTIRRNVIQSGFRNTAVGASKWRATMPCRGERLFLASNSGTPSVQVEGSYRFVDRISQDVMNANPTFTGTKDDANYLYMDRVGAINAGTMAQYDLYPWIGSITADVRYTSTAVPGTSYARWVANTSAGSYAIRHDAIGADPDTNGYGLTSTIAMNGDAVRFELNNATAANWANVNVTISPTGGVGI